MHQQRKASTSKKNIYAVCALIAAALLLPLFFMFVAQPQPEYLSAADKKWLTEHGHRIEVLGYEAPPESYHDDEGEYVGFVVDFLHEVEQLLGTSFRIRHFASWDELMDYAGNHHNFIIVGIAETNDRQRYLAFTDAFVKIPYVVLVRKSNTQLTLSTLQQGQVCTIKGYAVNEYMEEFFPEITLRHVSDDVHGLRSLATGECDALVASQAHATFLAEQQGLTNLRIIGEIGYINRLGIAVAKQDMQLHEILEKTVDQISPERQRAIYRRWVATDFALSRATQSALALAAIVIFGLMAVSWFWSLSLKITVRNQTSQIRHDLQRIQQAEEALREKTQELEQFFNATQDLLAIVDTDGYFHRLNRHWAQVFGYSLAELENRCFFDFLHPEDTPATREAFNALQTRRDGSNFTNRYRCRDGAYRWLEWRATPVGRYVYTAARDITARKKMEDNLKQTNLVVENSPAILFRREAVAGWPIILVSRNVDQFGYSAAEILNGAVDFARVVHPEDSKRVNRIAKDHIADGADNFQQEYRIITKDGTPRWVDERTVIERDMEGQATHLQGILLDITERKQAEAALQASETRFRDISAMASDWFWEQNDQFRFTFFSRGETMSGLEQIGVGPNQLLGKTRWELPIRLSPDQWAAHRAILETHQPFRDFEYPILAESGERRWFNVNGRPLFNAEGHFIGYRGTGRDVTERKQAEETLRQSRNLLQTVLDSIPVRVFWKDLHLRYLGCNRAFAMDAGASSPEAMLGKDDYHFTWLKQAELYRSDDAEVLASGEPKIDYEEPQTAPDGRRIWLNSSKIPLRDADGEVFGVLGTYQDITERKQAEERLRFTNALLTAQQVASIDGILVVDEQGNVLSSNPRFAEIWSIPKSVLAEKSDQRVLQYMLDQLADPQEFLERVQYLYAHRDLTSREEVNLQDGRIFDRYSAPMLGSNDTYYGRIWFFRDITERRRAEEALRQANLVVENSPVILFRWKNEEGWPIAFVTHNVRQLGYAAEEFLDGSIHFASIVHSDDLERVSRELQEYTDKGVDSFQQEYRLITRDGNVRWIDDRTVVIRNAQGYITELQGIVIDITERKKVEHALNESLARFTSFAEATEYGFGMADLDTNITYVNASLARMLGESDPQATLGRKFPEYYPPDMVEKLRQEVLPQLLATGRWQGEMELLARDGQRRPVEENYFVIRDADGQTRYFGDILTDITERKQTEAQRDLLNMALEHALNGFDVVDEKMRFVYANPAYLRMWGYDSLEEIVGTSPITHCADPTIPEEITAKLRADGDYVCEFTAQRKDGSTFEVLMANRQFSMSDGQQLFIGSCLDITDRKRAEEELGRYRERLEELVAERTAELERANNELRQAMSQLVQAEKLAALGNLVAGVAHELNTPLGNARTVASALSEHLHEFATAADTGALRRSQLEQFLSRSGEAAQLLERNTARAAELISHFKQVAVDQTSMRRRRFNLRQTLEEVLATLKPQFKRTAHRLTLDIPADLELDSYPGPLEQVITNLIGNSLTHGFVGITAGVMRIHAAPLDGEQVRLEYTDNGVGIPASVLDRIFEPFFTTRLGSGGSGLGLYITYNLVNGVLGGTIEVHSTVGQGVRFTLSLPARAPHRPALDTLA